MATSSNPKSEARWLDVEYYTEASDGFASYDPEQWLPTLSFFLSDFMFWPWAIISGICLALTCYVEIIDPEKMPWVDAPIDAHVILGGALSFLVVMRTDASCVASSSNAWHSARSLLRARPRRRSKDVSMHASSLVLLHKCRTPPLRSTLARAPTVG